MHATLLEFMQSESPGLFLAFLLFTGSRWYESDQIRITYIDTRLCKKGSHLSTVVSLVVEKVHQAMKVFVGGSPLHACVIEGMV